MSNSEKLPDVFEIALPQVSAESGLNYLLQSKAPLCVREFGDQYYIVSCTFNSRFQEEVEIKPHDPKTRLGSSIENLRSEGMKVHLCKWLIPGYPSGLIFDLSSCKDYCTSWKQQFAKMANLSFPSIDSNSDMNYPIIFGFMIAKFFAEYLNRARPDENFVIGHFHHWRAGVGMTICRKWHLKMATVYTAHTTTLGRKLSTEIENFYEQLPHINPMEEAEKRGILQVHKIEKVAAECAHVFTTVSRITSQEVKWILQRKPDVILPNGVRLEQKVEHLYENRHQTSKKKIHDFIQNHFRGQALDQLSVDNTLYFVTAGDYDFKSKGYDLYIRALQKLNDKLKQEESEITVVGLVLVPMKSTNLNVTSLHSQAVGESLKTTIHEIEEAFGKRLFDAAMRGKVLEKEKIITASEMVRLKGQVLNSKRKENPPIVTHNIIDSESDPILQEIRNCQLFNSDSDKVKILVIPDTLEALDMDLIDTICGCNLGVFPSLYEPWGYIQAHCLQNSIPVITSNVSGFGSFLEKNLQQPSWDLGVYIVDRAKKSHSQVTDSIYTFMLDLCHRQIRDRVIQRTRVQRIGKLLSWNLLEKRYRVARNLALTRAFPDEFELEDLEMLKI